MGIDPLERYFSNEMIRYTIQTLNLRQKCTTLIFTQFYGLDHRKDGEAKTSHNMIKFQAQTRHDERGHYNLGNEPCLYGSIHNHKSMQGANKVSS